MNPHPPPLPTQPQLASRRQTLRLGALWAATAASGAGVLSACGGGDLAVAVLPGGGGTGAIAPPAPGPAPTGGTASGPPDIGFGVLTAPNPLTSTGTVWQTASTFSQRISDPEAEGLQAGMVVQIQGTLDVDGASGVAIEVSVRPALRGPVQSVSATGFVIASVPVLVSARTLWARAAALAQVRVGAVWQVHGHLQTSGSQTLGSQTTVLATRVVQAQSQLDVAMVSAIANVSAATTPGGTASFSLNGQTYTGVPIGIAASALRQNALVHTTFSASSRVATEFAEVLSTPPNNARLRVQGVLYSHEDGVLRVNGLPVAFAANLDPNVALMRSQPFQFVGSYTNGQFLVASAVLLVM